MAVILITLGHLVVSVALWRLGGRIAGLILLIFFLAALGADSYEHFLHASANNVFMLAPVHWAVWFDASVVVLLALEILGCSIGTWLLSGRMGNRNRAPGVNSSLNHPDLRLSASLS